MRSIVKRRRITSFPVLARRAGIIARSFVFSIFLLFLILVVTLVPAGIAMAQDGTPEEVAERYFEHMQAGEWEAIAKLVDEEALTSFAAFFHFILSLDKTGEVALALSGGDWTAEDARDATPEELFAKFMKFFAGASFAEGSVTFDGVRILGSVREGEDLAHVVYRSWAVVNGVQASQVNAITLRKGTAGWRIMLRADVDPFIQLVATMFPGE